MVPHHTIISMYKFVTTHFDWLLVRGILTEDTPLPLLPPSSTNGIFTLLIPLPRLLPPSLIECCTTVWWFLQGRYTPVSVLLLLLFDVVV